VIFVAQLENKRCGAGSHVITPYKGTNKLAARKTPTAPTPGYAAQASAPAPSSRPGTSCANSAAAPDTPMQVLVLVLGLRRGEVLGLAWDQVDLDDAELYVGEQLQRVRGKLVRREVKTETSEAPLPLPGLCIAALKIRRKQQDADRARAGDGWIDSGLVSPPGTGPRSSRVTSTAVSIGV
jgi:integrase